MILIRMGKYNMIDILCLVVNLYVLYKLFASIQEATVNNMDLFFSIDRIANADRVATLCRFNRQKINLYKISHDGLRQETSEKAVILQASEAR